MRTVPDSDQFVISDSYEKINAGGPQPILKAYRVREEDVE